MKKNDKSDSMFCSSFQPSTINPQLLTLVISLLFTLGVCGAGTENILTDLGYSAGETGMGETGYFSNERATIIKTNVSALSTIDKVNIEWTHTELNNSQWNDYVAVAVPTEGIGMKLGIGMIWNRLWVDGIPLTEEGDTIDGTNFTEIINSGTTNYTMNEYGIGISGNKGIVSAGALIKYSHGSITDYTMNGIGVNAGVTIAKDINAGILQTAGIMIGAKDIGGTRLYWNTGTEEKTDMKVEIGAGVGLIKTENDNSMLNFEGAVSRRFMGSSEMEIKGGAELYILPIVPIRVGYKGDAITAGIGIETEKIRVDYSISDKAELEPVHKISLGLVF
ncbi:MAG: hypothetical protein QME48_05840 [bacterium]|nr:hypothetical protein [bacterium]